MPAKKSRIREWAQALPSSALRRRFDMQIAELQDRVAIEYRR
jgi:hypothetical protein